MNKKKAELSETIYSNKGRFWWKVTLPGEAKVKHIPLKPDGARYATKDRKVAEAIARNILKKHHMNVDGPRVCAPHTVAIASPCWVGQETRGTV